MLRSPSMYSRDTISRDPFSLTEPVADFTAATRRSIRGLRIAYSPNLDVFPVDRKVADTVSRALRAFEEAGAHVEEVKLGVQRSQKELSDVWSRLYMLLNLQAIENMKRDGIDLFGKHREDFPPEYLGWVETTRRMSGLDFFRDQAVRSEVYNAFQNVFELVRSAGYSNSCLPSRRQCQRWQHGRPKQHQRSRDRSSDRMVSDVFREFYRSSGGVDSSGIVR